jgi:hypothetical protein
MVSGRFAVTKELEKLPDSGIRTQKILESAVTRADSRKRDKRHSAFWHLGESKWEEMLGAVWTGERRRRSKQCVYE